MTMPTFDRLKLLFIVVFSSAVSYFLLSRNLDAEFGIIDDHRILFFLGPDKKLALSDIPRLFLASSGGRPFETPRYTPVQFILWFVEAFLWGDSACLWYLSRLLLFALSFFIYWRLFERKIGLVAGFVFIVSLFSFPFWSQTFTRLLTSEVYALPATAIHFLGFVRVVEETGYYTARKWKSVLNWTLVFIGAIVAIGVKENFLFLLLPTGILFIFAWRERILNWLAVSYTALIFAFGAFVASSVIYVLRITGTDLYNRSVEPSAISKLVYPAFSALLFDKTVLLCIAIVFAVFLLRSIVVTNGNDAETQAVCRRSLSVFLLTFLGSIALYASQYIFYTGHWPIGNRYDFPGVYAKPLIFFATAAFIVSISDTFKNGRYLKIVTLVLFSMLMALRVDFAGLSMTRQESAKNAAVTSDFNRKINHVAQELKSEPAANLMLVINDPRYYEHLLSAPRFLRYHGVKNPIYLWVPEYSRELAEKTNTMWFVRSIERTSRVGTREVSPEGYTFSFFNPKDAINPFDEFKSSNEKCFAISFLGAAEVPGCVDTLEDYRPL
jgi:hypothetical protein